MSFALMDALQDRIDERKQAIAQAQAEAEAELADLSERYEAERLRGISLLSAKLLETARQYEEGFRELLLTRAVGRRTRSATTPAASRSIAAACSEPPISTPLIVVTSSPGVTPAAAARPPGWSALTMARCGAAVAAASFRSNEMPIRTVGSDFASLIVRNSSGGGAGGARTRGAAPPPFWRKRPLDMAAALSP